MPPRRTATSTFSSISVGKAKRNPGLINPKHGVGRIPGEIACLMLSGRECLAVDRR